MSSSSSANGEEYLDVMAGPSSPGLLVLDLMMPVLAGLEVLSRRRDEEALRKIPVVVLSAAIDSPRLADAGASALLRKPYPISSLLETIRQHVTR